MLVANYPTSNANLNSTKPDALRTLMAGEPYGVADPVAYELFLITLYADNPYTGLISDKFSNLNPSSPIQ